jgi:hypothetical protein
MSTLRSETCARTRGVAERAMRRRQVLTLATLAGLAASLLWAGAPGGAQGPIRWEQWVHQSGVFDVVGPRGDGRLLAAAGGRLVLVDLTGTVTPFADGPGGYRASAPGSESYVALSPGLTVQGAGCAFGLDDAFALDLPPGQPSRVLRIDTSGRASPFGAAFGDDLLNGIAFDTVGRFDHRLLVIAVRSVQGENRGVVRAIDCKGKVDVLTDTAPVFEGGVAVAPLGFGSHGGELIAPDETSGRVYGIDPRGRASLVVESGVPAGGDIGVESVGVVPPGFSRGGFAYVADRATPNNPHPGTDSVLRLRGSDLLAAGVMEGDVLVASEGAATTIAIHCSQRCVGRRVAEGPPTAHIEGHVTFDVNPGATSGPPPLPGVPLTRIAPPDRLPLVIVVAVAIAAFGLVFLLLRLR